MKYPIGIQDFGEIRPWPSWLTTGRLGNFDLRLACYTIVKTKIKCAPRAPLRLFELSVNKLAGAQLGKKCAPDVPLGAPEDYSQTAALRFPPPPGAFCSTPWRELLQGVEETVTRRFSRSSPFVFKRRTVVISFSMSAILFLFCLFHLYILFVSRLIYVTLLVMK